IVATRSHHLLNDGWTAVRHFERITKNYALLEKDPAYRFEMDRRFLDTLRSDQLYGWSQEHREDESFWRSWQRADGEPLVTRLADRPYAIEAAPRVSSLRRECEPGLQVKLVHAAETLSLSLAELLTALTGVYLALLSGEDSIVFAVPFLNRTRETLDIPGQFAKIVPLRLSFDSLGSSLAGVVREAGEAFRMVLRHGRYPYGDLVRRCGFEPRHADVSVNTLLLRRGIEIGGEPAHVQWLSGPENGLSFLFTQFGRTAPLGFEMRFNGGVF